MELQQHQPGVCCHHVAFSEIKGTLLLKHVSPLPQVSTETTSRGVQKLQEPRCCPEPWRALFWLCDLGEVHQFSAPQSPHLYGEEDKNANLLRLL